MDKIAVAPGSLPIEYEDQNLACSGKMATLPGRWEDEDLNYVFSARCSIDGRCQGPSGRDGGRGKDCG